MASESPDPESRDFSYAAFVSYNHNDNRDEGRMWGEWIQKTVEDFRIPATQPARAKPMGSDPNRIGPVFLDRSELPAGGVLVERLREALEQSKFLLVLCSPNSVNSDYVGEEIQPFK